MKDTSNIDRSDALVADAKGKIAANMLDCGIGAIIWDLGRAGFHYIPELIVGTDKKDEPTVVRVTGLYAYDGRLYAIEEGTHDTAMRDYFKRGEDVPPVVVTLTPSAAAGDFGDPSGKKGFTEKGTNEEWLVVADCYFEALSED